MTSEIFRKLKKFNAVMGVLHAIQGSLMLALSNDFTVPVTRNYVALGSRGLVQTNEVLCDLRLGPVVAMFLFASAVAHFMIAFVVYDKYVAGLKKGINKYRWYEYSVSASIMIVVIGMLSGVWDIASIIMLFSLNASMILFGYVMELHNQMTEKTDWRPFIYGCFAGAVPWIAIIIYFVRADPPGFVYWIMLSIGVFFNCFALNMYLQYKKWGKWKDYIYGERMYIILSLVAKSLLAWQVFAGTLMPS